MNKSGTPEQQYIIGQFLPRFEAEVWGDVDTILATMTADPHLYNIPTLIGGLGLEGVKILLYSNLIPFNKFFPPTTNGNNGSWVL